MSVADLVLWIAIGINLSCGAFSICFAILDSRKRARITEARRANLKELEKIVEQALTERDIARSDTQFARAQYAMLQSALAKHEPEANDTAELNKAIDESVRPELLPVPTIRSIRNAGL